MSQVQRMIMACKGKTLSSGGANKQEIADFVGKPISWTSKRLRKELCVVLQGAPNEAKDKTEEKPTKSSSRSMSSNMEQRIEKVCVNPSLTRSQGGLNVTDLRKIAQEMNGFTSSINSRRQMINFICTGGKTDSETQSKEENNQPELKWTHKQKHSDEERKPSFVLGKDVTSISGPVTFTVAPSVLGRTFYMMGDEHGSNKGMCKHSCRSCINATEFTHHLASLSTNLDVFMETGDGSLLKQIYGDDNSFVPLPLEEALSLKLAPLDEFGVVFDFCAVTKLGQECQKLYPNAKFHWADVRKSTKANLEFITKMIFEFRKDPNLSCIFLKAQTKTDWRDDLRKAGVDPTNLNEIGDFVFRIISEDNLISKFPIGAGQNAIGKEKLWVAPAGSESCVGGCHRIRKQLRNADQLFTPAGSFTTTFYKWARSEIDLIVNRNVEKSDSWFEEFGERDEYYTQQLATDFAALLVDFYTMARCFKYEDQQNIVVYMGSNHIKRQLRFLKMLTDKDFITYNDNAQKDDKEENPRCIPLVTRHTVQ